MKRQRYEDVHRAALRWPARAFEYHAIDNDHAVEADYAGEVRRPSCPVFPSFPCRVADRLERGVGLQRKGGLEPFVKDSYACHATLAAKRRHRNSQSASCSST